DYESAASTYAELLRFGSHLESGLIADCLCGLAVVMAVQGRTGQSREQLEKAALLTGESSSNDITSRLLALVRTPQLLWTMWDILASSPIDRDGLLSFFTQTDSGTPYNDARKVALE